MAMILLFHCGSFFFFLFTSAVTEKEINTKEKNLGPVLGLNAGTYTNKNKCLWKSSYKM